MHRGFTMVELMIGMAVGLFIVAAAASLMTGSLRENRNLVIESRLMQDLRTAADLITRDLRRAGYWAAANTGVRSDGTSATAANPYLDVTPSSAAADNVTFRFSRDTTENNTVDSNEQFGFRLRNGAIELQLGAGNWQALTDATTLNITEFSVTPTVEEISLANFCATPCPAGSTTCPPRQQVRSLAVAISGRATGDARLVRSIRSQVRLRNDPIVGTCPA
jgi:type IV pilus assembly protein PilW